MTAGTVWCYIELITQATRTPVRILCSSTSLSFLGADRYDERKAQQNPEHRFSYALCIDYNIYWHYYNEVTMIVLPKGHIMIWSALSLEIILKYFCVFYSSIYRFLHFITEHQELCLILLNPGVSE